MIRRIQRVQLGSTSLSTLYSKLLTHPLDITRHSPTQIVSADTRPAVSLTVEPSRDPVNRTWWALIPGDGVAHIQSRPPPVLEHFWLVVVEPIGMVCGYAALRGVH